MTLLWSLLLLCAACAFVAEGRTAEEEDWLECHGMSREEYEATKQCMKELRYQKALQHGRNTTDLSDDVVSGDIIYSLERCEYELNNIHGRKKRKIIDFAMYGGNKWPLPILYEWDSAPTADDRLMIEAAMAHWEAETCVRFQLYDTNVHSSSTDRLRYTAEDNGCYSYIGKVPSLVPQQVNLQTSGCTGTIGIPVHEIGHAIGLYHEQSRPDRGDWLNVNLASVDTSRLNNFDITSTSDDHGCPYDYGSIMHYASRDFSTNCTDVLTPTEPYSEYTLGQRGHLSFHDAKIVNIAYCADKCAGSPALACENSGYQDPNDCSKCRCPEGFGGILCDEAAVRVTGCNPATGNLYATESEQYVSSPGYEDGLPYSVGDECSWIIRAPDGCHVQARFELNNGVLCVGSDCRGQVCYNWVELKYKADKMLRGGRFCCYDLANSFNHPADDGWVTSEDEEMVVHFDGTWPQTSNAYTFLIPDAARGGFKLCYKTVCMTTTTEPTTTEPTTTEPTTTEPTTIEPTTIEPTTIAPTTIEPTTIEPTTIEPTTIEPTTIEPTTPVATTTTIESPTWYCDEWVDVTQCSLPCGGCGCNIVSRTCYLKIGPIILSITFYTARPCNVVTCDLSLPSQSQAYQWVFVRIGDFFFIFRRLIPMPCCFNFCNDPPTYLVPWQSCNSDNPKIHPVCPA